MYLLLFLLSATSAAVGLYTDLRSCPLHPEPVGCYNDRVRDLRDRKWRALTEQILNARDPTSQVYINPEANDWGPPKDLFKNYAVILPDLICKCAKIASKRGYRVIAIQHTFECWSGEGEFNEFGATSTCLTSRFQNAANASRQCEPSAGGRKVNYVYRIAPMSCDELYEPVGCYNDVLKWPRPLPHLLFTERDFTSRKSNGHLIDWVNWNMYNPQLICRCAVKARELGLDFFGIQFWGECWGGSERSQALREGPSRHCSNEHFTPCPCNSYHCVGRAKTNYVYKLKKPF